MKTKTLYVCEKCSGEYHRQDWAEECENSPDPILPAGVEEGQPVKLRKGLTRYVMATVVEADMINKGGLLGNTVPGHAFQLKLAEAVYLEPSWESSTKFVGDHYIVDEAEAATLKLYDPAEEA